MLSFVDLNRFFRVEIGSLQTSSATKECPYAIRFLCQIRGYIFYVCFLSVVF